MTPIIGRVRAKWAKELFRENQNRVGPPSTTFKQSKQPHRQTGCMPLMIEVIDSHSMVGENMTSNQILQQEVGNSSSLKGATTTTDNVVVLKTNLGGRGSSKSTFLAKREC